MRCLDIVVPIYRNAAMARACVESLLAHREEIAERKPRIVLIDDSPGDPQVEAMLALFVERERVLVMRNDGNLGFVQTANRGLAQALAAGRDALLVNSDTLSFAGTLMHLSACIQADPRIGFAAPRSNHAAICSLPHLPSATSSDPADACRAWSALAMLLPPLHVVPTLVGFYLLVTLPVLEEVGMFDTAFGVGYEEENDLIQRAARVGYRAAMANHAFAFHHGSASFAATGLALAPHRRRNLDILLERHPTFRNSMRRYERSAHFRAEHLLAGLLPDEQGRIRVAFDLTDVDSRRLGIAEKMAQAVESLMLTCGDRLAVTVVCSAALWERLGFAANRCGLAREDPGGSGLHAIAVHVGMAFDRAALARLDALAPVNVRVLEEGLADPTILNEALGCRAAHAVIFASRTGLETFRSLGRQADVPCIELLLPDCLVAAATRGNEAVTDEILVVAGSSAGVPDILADLRGRFDRLRLAVLDVAVPGAREPEDGHLADMPRPAVAARFARARATLFLDRARSADVDADLLLAVAAGCPVVAPSSAALDELVRRTRGTHVVCGYETRGELATALERVLQQKRPVATADPATRWSEAAEHLARSLLSLVRGDDLFVRLKARQELLALERRGEPDDEDGDVPPDDDTVAAAPLPLDELLALEGPAFVRHAYATLLRRPADTSGMAFYLSRLRDGVDRVDMLDALARSPEGRARDVRLAGLEERLHRRRSVVARLMRRVLHRQP